MSMAEDLIPHRVDPHDTMLRSLPQSAGFLGPSPPCRDQVLGHWLQHPLGRRGVLVHWLYDTSIYTWAYLWWGVGNKITNLLLCITFNVKFILFIRTGVFPCPSLVRFYDCPPCTDEGSWCNRRVRPDGISRISSVYARSSRQSKMENYFIERSKILILPTWRRRSSSSIDIIFTLI